MEFKFNFKLKEKFTPKTGDLFSEKCYHYPTGYYIRLHRTQSNSIMGEVPDDKFAALNLETNKIVLLLKSPQDRYYAKLEIFSHEVQDS